MSFDRGSALALAVLTLISLAGCRERGAPPAPVAPTNHFYEFVAAPNSTWTEANAAASLHSHDGVTGYLATIDSPEENELVTAVLPEIQAGDTLEGAYLGATRAKDSRRLDEGWSWMSGEPWSYANWAGGEPNGPDETYLAIWLGSANSWRPRGTWNDATDSGKLIAGYVVEYEPPPSTSP